MSLPSTGGYHLGPGEGEPTWFLDTLMIVKAGTEQTGGAFTLLEWSAPRGFGPPSHVHHREDEVFYILDGSMDVVCGEQRWTAVDSGIRVTGAAAARGAARVHRHLQRAHPRSADHRAGRL